MRFALRDVELILNFEYKNKYNISDLLRIMEILRSPDGCPWDREQNHQSIKKNLIEETYEVVEAINKDDKELLCEELGDLLLQIVFHSQMEAEQGVFDFEAVCDGICKKLIERHPHVFGTLEVGGSAEVLENWEQIKRRTKKRDTTYDALEAIPAELPALMRSDKILSKAQKAGLWQSSAEESKNKLSAFIKDISETDKLPEEVGRLLFEAVRLSRALNIDPEDALARYCTSLTESFRDVKKDEEGSLESLL